MPHKPLIGYDIFEVFRFAKVPLWAAIKGPFEPIIARGRNIAKITKIAKVGKSTS
jgi:hypothetical protein